MRTIVFIGITTKSNQVVRIDYVIYIYLLSNSGKASTIRKYILRGSQLSDTKLSYLQ